MRSYTLLTVGGLLTPLTFAATFDVDVGKSGFVFDPDTIDAQVGDIVNFHFYPGDHSVAQSTFEAPCQPSSPNAIFSGFINSGSGEAKTMFSMSVNTTDPIWLYCGQVGHCASGMAMVINPPTGANTLDGYKKAASGASTSVPANVFGGSVVPNVDADENSNNSSSASTTMSATATSGSTSATAASSSPAPSAASSHSVNAGVPLSIEWTIFSALLVPGILYLLK